MIDSEGSRKPTELYPLDTTKPTTKDAVASVSEAELLNKEKRKKEEAKNKHRYIFAWVFVGVGVLWTIGSFVLLCCAGNTEIKFKLSDAAIIAILGTGTINVLGPAYMVSKYLFGNGR